VFSLKRALELFTLTLLSTGIASAQRCSGNPSFGSARTHLAASAGVDRLAQRYAAEIRLGFRRVFAAVEVGMKTWNVTNLAKESGVLGVSAGLQFPRGRESRLEVCPLLSWTSLAGPENVVGTSWKYTEKVYSGGLTAGYVLARTKTWDFTPAAAITFGSSDPRMRSPWGGNLPQYQDFCCGRRSFTTLWFGVGLGFGHEFTLLPAIAVPLGAAGETTYQFRAVVRFAKTS
jgi:hypothetical protein